MFAGVFANHVDIASNYAGRLQEGFTSWLYILAANINGV
jgi:hypothetical protein